MGLLSILSMSVLASAQQTAPSSETPKAPAQEKKIEKKEQSRRMLGLPHFTVTDRKNAPPLTPKRKFRLFYKSAFDPAEFVVVGLQAGISQAQNSFAAYGQGASGYYGAAFTDQVTSTFFADFAYPTLLRKTRVISGSARAQ
jgi:hypothetical protein